MKKSLIAVTTIAILAAGYVGASWYTGKVIEDNIDNSLAEFTDQLNSQTKLFDTKISYSNYQKGIFSTKLHLTINAHLKEDEVNQRVNSKEFDDIIFDDDITIYHGPFPIAAVTKGHLLPLKSWIEYTTTEAASPKLWQLAGNKPFITAYAGVSYQNAINLNVMSRPIDYQNKEDEQLLLSAGEMTLKSRHNFAIEELNIDLDKFAYLVKGVALPVINFENWHLAVQPNSDNSATTYRFKADNFDINIPDKLIGAKVGIAINNLQSQGSIHNINMDVTYKAKADKISINYPLFDSNNSELLINDLTIEQAYQLKQSKYVDGSFKSTVGSLNYGKQNIGSGVLNMDFKGINFKEIDLYSYFDQDNLPNDNAKPAPLIFNIDKLNWHNSEGDINLVINLALTGVNSFDADVGMDNIESMKFKFDAPSRVIAKILAQWNNPSQDGVISRQVDNMDSYVQMMGQLFFNHSDMILFEKDGVKGFFTDVNYQKTAPNVYINGNKMDKRSFLNNFDDLEEDIDDDMEDDF